MDITPSTAPSMGPPTLSSPAGDRNGTAQTSTGESDGATNGTSGPAVGAAAAAQQPKVVQTAFIHKLYNMLEDQSIQHLISWSSTNESFVMSPSSDFSKVLSYVDRGALTYVNLTSPVDRTSSTPTFPHSSGN